MITRNAQILPQAVMIKGNNNTRHMGGYELGSTGKKTNNRLIRSGVPSGFTEEDIRVLAEVHNLKKVVDLRTRGEMEAEPSLEQLPGVEYIPFDLNIDYANVADLSVANEVRASGAENHWIDMYYQYGGTVAASIDAMERIYLYAVTQEHVVKKLAEFFDLMLETEEGSILFHCTVGKDRTGVIAALVLSMLGAEWDVVKADYLLTNTFRAEYLQEQQAAVAKLTESEAVRRGTAVLMSAEVVFLEDMRKTIETHYGSVKQFITDKLNLTEAKIERLKALYTE